MSRRYVATKVQACPRCQSTRTLAALKEGGTTVLLRGCQACGHEWDKSEACQRIERMTMADFDAMIDMMRADDAKYLPPVTR